MTTISKFDNIIDSRDVIERLDELKGELESAHEEANQETSDRIEEIEAELEAFHDDQETTLSFEYALQDAANFPDHTAEYEELQALKDAEDMDFDDWVDEQADNPEAPCHDEAEEFKALDALAEEAQHYGDWMHGETLIHRNHFQDYAQQLAEDIGAMPDNAAWPCNCIDWEQAANELEQDYTAVDFDGEEFLMRA